MWRITMDRLELFVRTIDDKFGKDIVAIDMKLASPMFDTFIICTADNARLLNAIKDNVQDELDKHEIFVKKIEGARDSQWILMDYGDIVIHIFSPEERHNYQLEKLWGDQHRIDISAFLEKPNEL